MSWEHLDNNKDGLSNRSLSFQTTICIQSIFTHSKFRSFFLFHSHLNPTRSWSFLEWVKWLQAFQKGVHIQESFWINLEKKKEYETWNWNWANNENYFIDKSHIVLRILVRANLFWSKTKRLCILTSLHFVFFFYLIYFHLRTINECQKKENKILEKRYQPFLWHYNEV